MYTLYCILYTLYCILYTLYSILYTVYCILYTVYVYCRYNLPVASQRRMSSYKSLGPLDLSAAFSSSGWTAARALSDRRSKKNKQMEVVCIANAKAKKRITNPKRFRKHLCACICISYTYLYTYM